MTTFAIRSWANVTPGGSWSTFHSRMWTSTETHAELWSRTWDIEANKENFDFPNSGEWSHFQNNTMMMFPGEPWVYVYGTNEGRWSGGGIHLMRVDWREMWKRSAYEFWGQDGANVWAWRRNGTSTPVIVPTIPGGRIGEISTQVIDGRVVISYCDDVLGPTTRTSPRPEGIWTNALHHFASGAVDVAPYAPVIHPYSHLGRAQMLMSSWVQIPVAEITINYGVKQWEVTLNGSDFGSLSGSQAARASIDNVGNAGELIDSGYKGDLAPDLSKLPLEEQIAVVAASSDNTADRSWLRDALTGRIKDSRPSIAERYSSDTIPIE